MDPKAVTVTDTDTGDGAEEPFRFPTALEERYQPRRCLGAGGMGAVFEAYDRDLERVVAVKVTMPVGSPVYFRRFQREAEALARLDHPGVVRIYAHGETDLCPYIVMEHLEGESLSASVGKLETMDCMLQVAQGLEAIHAAGLVHRDVKPGNVVITPDGRAVLVDFGVAFDPERSRLTRFGSAVGTAGFMPPEVYSEEDAGPPADWFAWGVTLFLLGEGRLPYTAQEIMGSLGTRKLPLLRFERMKPNRPPAELIRRCLEWDPVARLSSVAEIKKILRIKGDLPVRRRPPTGAIRLPDRGLRGSGDRPERPPTYPGLEPPRSRRGWTLALVAAALVLLGLALHRGGPLPGASDAPDPEAVGPSLTTDAARTLVMPGPP